MLSESFDNMDQFFAAVEQRDNPELKGKPIAVGHDAERGVVNSQLRSPSLWRSFSTVHPGGQATMSAAHHRGAPLPTIQGSVCPTPRDLPRLHRPDRAHLPGRSLSRCDRKQERYRSGR